MSQSHPWVKVWWTWYTSRSHIGLSPVALALGAPLMLIGRACAERHGDASSDGGGDASGDGACDTVWLRNEDGSNVTPEDVAAVSRYDVESTRTAMLALVGRKTLVVSDDGCFGIAKFWKYQETASAARNRKYLAKQKRHGDAPSDGVGDDKRKEVRGKSNSSAEPKQRRRNPAYDAVHDAVMAEYAKVYPDPKTQPHSLNGGLVQKLATWANGDLEPLRSSLRAYLSDAYWAGEGHPFATWAGDPTKFLRKAGTGAGGVSQLNAIQARIDAFRAEKRRYQSGPDFSLAEQERIDAEIAKLERQLPRQAGAR